MEKRHIRELDYFNGVACLLVILIHVLSLGVTNLQHDSWQMAVIYFPWRLSAFVVPGFLFVGGAKLAVQQNFSYGKYILGRVKKVYVPYVLWTCVYYVLFALTGFVSGLNIKELGLYILRGDLSGQFYYVIIVMQFYLLAPVWRLITDKVPWYAAPVPAFFLTMVLYKVPGAVGFAYGDRVFTTYLWFWIGGLYVGKHWAAVRGVLVRSKALLIGCAATCAGFAVMCYMGFARGIYLWDLDFVKLAADTGAIILLLGLCCRAEEKTRLCRGLRFIHRASYGVYLSHCLLLTLGTSFLQRLGVGSTEILLAARFVLGALPFGYYLIKEKIKPGP